MSVGQGKAWRLWRNSASHNGKGKQQGMGLNERFDKRKALIAQRIEQRSSKPQVSGSSPDESAQ